MILFWQLAAEALLTLQRQSDMVLQTEGRCVGLSMQKNVMPTACLPIGAVLTIAAAGSEMSNSSVITNEDGRIKTWL